MNRILFASSEVYPLIKTGGLADVSGSLPPALSKLGEDVRIIMPAYGPVLRKLKKKLATVASVHLPGICGEINILETKLPRTSTPVWLVQYGPAFDRDGNPYLNEQGSEWIDNAERFALFCRTVQAVAQGTAGLAWIPDIVHCNDWQTGLVPALLHQQYPRPVTVFTIHNLSYQGLFPYSKFHALGLPTALWSTHGLEYFGQFSFIKGGLQYADMLTTVSPNYAKEIQEPRFGFGLDGLLHHRADRLTGILNGIDVKHWDPAKDPHLEQSYSVKNLPLKLVNKVALQKQFKLPASKDIPLIGMIGRLVQQKGIDLVLGALPNLVQENLQLVILGSGDKGYEKSLAEWAKRYPDKIAVHIGYDESLAHRIEAGVDLFLMPSRFEPCGLNQMYSQRYGTLPIVHHVGGLADTVVNADAAHLADNSASGIVFYEESIDALEQAVHQGLMLYQQPKTWLKVQRTAMEHDFSWKHSAHQYLALYQKLLSE